MTDEWHDMADFPRDGTLVEVRAREGDPVGMARWNKKLNMVEIVTTNIGWATQWRVSSQMDLPFE